jgi:hypothetical protein
MSARHFDLKEMLIVVIAKLNWRRAASGGNE